MTIARDTARPAAQDGQGGRTWGTWASMGQLWLAAYHVRARCGGSNSIAASVAAEPLPPIAACTARRTSDASGGDFGHQQARHGAGSQREAQDVGQGADQGNGTCHACRLGWVLANQVLSSAVPVECTTTHVGTQAHGRQRQCSTGGRGRAALGPQASTAQAAHTDTHDPERRTAEEGEREAGGHGQHGEAHACKAQAHQLPAV